MKPSAIVSMAGLGVVVSALPPAAGTLDDSASPSIVRSHGTAEITPNGLYGGKPVDYIKNPGLVKDWEICVDICMNLIGDETVYTPKVEVFNYKRAEMAKYLGDPGESDEVESNRESVTVHDTKMINVKVEVNHNKRNVNAETITAEIEEKKGWCLCEETSNRNED